MDRSIYHYDLIRPTRRSHCSLQSVQGREKQRQNNNLLVSTTKANEVIHQTPVASWHFDITFHDIVRRLSGVSTIARHSLLWPPTKDDKTSCRWDRPTVSGKTTATTVEAGVIDRIGKFHCLVAKSQPATMQQSSRAIQRNTSQRCQTNHLLS